MSEPSAPAALARVVHALSKGASRVDKALEAVDRKHEVNREEGLAEWLSLNLLAILRWLGAEDEVGLHFSPTGAWADDRDGYMTRLVATLTEDLSVLRDVLRPVLDDDVPHASSKKGSGTTRRPPTGPSSPSEPGAALSKAVAYFNSHRVTFDVAAARVSEALLAIRNHQYAQMAQVLPAYARQGQPLGLKLAGPLPISSLWGRPPAGSGAYPRLELQCKYPLEKLSGMEKNGVQLCLFSQVECDAEDDGDQWESFTARVSVQIAADAEAQSELAATIRCLTPGCEVTAIRTSLDGYADERWDETTVTVALPELLPGSQHDFLVLGSVRSVGLVELVIHVGAQPWDRDAHRRLRGTVATLCGIELDHLRFAEVGEVGEDGAATILCAFPDHPKPRAAQASLFNFLRDDAAAEGAHALPYAVRYFSAAQPTAPDLSVSLTCRFRAGEAMDGSAGGRATKRVGFNTTQDVVETLTVEGCLSERWGGQSPRVREEVFRQNLCTILDRANRADTDVAAVFLSELSSTLTSPLYDHPLSELRQTPTVRELLWVALSDAVDLADPHERAALVASLRTQRHVENPRPRDGRAAARHTLHYTPTSNIEQQLHGACVTLTDELQRMQAYVAGFAGMAPWGAVLSAEEQARSGVVKAEVEARAVMRRRSRVDEKKAHSSFTRSSTNLHAATATPISQRTPSTRRPRSPSPAGFKRAATYNGGTGLGAHHKDDAKDAKVLKATTPRRKTGPQPTPRSTATPPRASTGSKPKRASTGSAYRREASGSTVRSSGSAGKKPVPAPRVGRASTASPSAPGMQKARAGSRSRSASSRTSTGKTPRGTSAPKSGEKRRDLSNVLASPNPPQRAMTTGEQQRGRNAPFSTTRPRMDRSGSPQFVRAASFTTSSYKLQAIGYAPEYRPQSRVGGVPHTAAGPTHPAVTDDTHRPLTLRYESPERKRWSPDRRNPGTPQRGGTSGRVLSTPTSLPVTTPASTPLQPRRASVSASPKVHGRRRVSVRSRSTSVEVAGRNALRSPSRDMFRAMKQHVLAREAEVRSSAAPVVVAQPVVATPARGNRVYETDTPLLSSVLQSPVVAMHKVPKLSLEADVLELRSARSPDVSPDRASVDLFSQQCLPYVPGDRVCVKCGTKAVGAILELAQVEFTTAYQRFVGASGTVVAVDPPKQTVTVQFDAGAVPTHDPATLLMEWPVAAVEPEECSPVPSRRGSLTPAHSPSRQRSTLSRRFDPPPDILTVNVTPPTSSFDPLGASTSMTVLCSSLSFPFVLGDRIRVLPGLRAVVEALEVAGIPPTLVYQAHAGRSGTIVDVNVRHFTVKIEFDVLLAGHEMEARDLWWPTSAVQPVKEVRMPYADAPPSLRKVTQGNQIIRRAVRFTTVHGAVVGALAAVAAGFCEPPTTPLTPCFTHWPYHSLLDRDRTPHGSFTVSQLRRAAKDTPDGHAEGMPAKPACEGMPVLHLEASTPQSAKKDDGPQGMPLAKGGSLHSLSPLYRKKRDDTEQSSMTNLKAAAAKTGYKKEPERVTDKKHSSLNSHVLFQRQRQTSAESESTADSERAAVKVKSPPKPSPLEPAALAAPSAPEPSEPDPPAPKPTPPAEPECEAPQQTVSEDSMLADLPPAAASAPAHVLSTSSSTEDGVLQATVPLSPPGSPFDATPLSIPASPVGILRGGRLTPEPPTSHNSTPRRVTIEEPAEIEALREERLKRRSTFSAGVNPPALLGKSSSGSPGAQPVRTATRSFDEDDEDIEALFSNSPSKRDLSPQKAVSVHLPSKRHKWSPTGRGIAPGGHPQSLNISGEIERPKNKTSPNMLPLATTRSPKGSALSRH
eukprot:TRINITY_DN18401_c0_g1_i1.p1 TRINITY_DN18401_c0_g1~~TRINITY_DN18401_c0_g1_i1.p1  ORF type:complete len:1827 (+),score=364.44 TRINITY_DN18401_c0_g1_i1:112-5592(+)